MSEPNATFRLIARIAGKAIEKQREQRRETGICDDSGVQALLVYITVIERLARGTLPEAERASLPPDENPDLVRRLKQELLEAADECRARRKVLH